MYKVVLLSMTFFLAMCERSTTQLDSSSSFKIPSKLKFTFGNEKPQINFLTDKDHSTEVMIADEARKMLDIGAAFQDMSKEIGGKIIIKDIKLSEDNQEMYNIDIGILGKKDRVQFVLDEKISKGQILDSDKDNLISIQYEQEDSGVYMFQTWNMVSSLSAKVYFSLEGETLNLHFISAVMNFKFEHPLAGKLEFPKSGDMPYKTQKEFIAKQEAEKPVKLKPSEPPVAVVDYQ